MKKEEKNTAIYNAPNAVIIINSTGIIVQWNQGAYSAFGWSSEEMIGKSFQDILLSAFSRERFLNKIKQFENTRNEDLLNESVEFSGHGKDNAYLEIFLSITSFSRNTELFYVCLITNITSGKQITSKLNKQKEFYENILNSIPTDIVVFDPRHKYLFVNPGAIKNEELRKYIIGKDDFEYAAFRKWDMSVAEKRRENFLQIKKTKKEIFWEDTIITPDGKDHTHLRRLFPVYNEEGELSMVIGFGIDITERKQMENKQSDLLTKLSVQNTQLTDFCNIVSHNLRAPLVNMKMLVQYIEDSTDEAEKNQMISMLNPVIENLDTVFNELVESIQIKHDHEIKSEKVILNDCLKRTLTGLDTEIKKCGAIFEVNFDEAPGVYYPPKYLHSIFLNLISNALKYKSPKRAPIIKIETKNEMDSIIFSVSDNGLGINLARHKDNIFKIGKVFSNHPDAKGFGLFMTKTQIEAMGDEIWVESAPDKGAAFFIKFKKHNR